MTVDKAASHRLAGFARVLGASERPLLLALALFIAIHLAWLIYRLPLPLEIFTNEAWNAWHAKAATGTRSLYPGKDELIINNYTPLSYYLVGYVGHLLGDVMLAGRVISLVAAVAIAGLIALIVRRFGGGRMAALAAALWWLASMFRSAAEYVGANDPTVPALAVMLGGFTWFLSRMDAGRSVLPPITVMVVAGFFKHNLVVLPVLALLWLARQNLSAALRAGLVGAALCGGGIAFCYAAYGPDFLTQLTLPREIRWLRPLQHMNRLQFMIVALVLSIIWIVRDRSSVAAQFTALWLGLGFASFAAQKLSPGVAINAAFELWIGAAVGFGLALASLGRNPRMSEFGPVQARAIVFAAVVVRLLADPNFDPYKLATASFRADTAARVAAFEREVEAVRTGPKPVGCNVMSVCFRAGEPFVFDNFGAGMRVAARHMQRADYEARIKHMGLQYRFSDRRMSWERNFPQPIQTGVTKPMSP